MPTWVPLTQTHAPSSTATLIEPPVGVPGTFTTFVNRYVSLSAGVESFMIPGAQIHDAPGMPDRFTSQPPPGHPYSVAPAGHGTGAVEFRHTC